MGHFDFVYIRTKDRENKMTLTVEVNPYEILLSKPNDRLCTIKQRLLILLKKNYKNHNMARVLMLAYGIVKLKKQVYTKFLRRTNRKRRRKLNIYAIRRRSMFLK